MAEGSPAQRRERDALVHETIRRDRDRESPDFGGGVDYHDHESSQRERIPLGGILHQGNVFPMLKGLAHLGRINLKHPQKIKFREDVHYIPWNHCVIGSVRGLT